MQAEAADAFDIQREPQSVRELYGDGLQGRQLLITRRLLERGVRVVQVWSGAGQPWDNHNDLEKQHRSLAGDWDGPIAAFLTDLKQRGLLDSTLVMWGGEFGRTPVAELPASSERPRSQSLRLLDVAGRRRRQGRLHPRRDRRFRLRRRAKTRSTSTTCTPPCCTCWASTTTKLTYRYAGRDFRLTDVHGRVVKELLA